jgi:hypothetical protein
MSQQTADTFVQPVVKQMLKLARLFVHETTASAQNIGK